MAKRYTIQLLMNLAKGIGANPQKFMGTRGNITFLGKGPTKNPLFQAPVAGLEGATEASMGPKESIIGAVEDAMGFASANKLNSIQIQALGINLENILKVYRPPVLPSASVTAIRPGIEGLRRFPRETHKFFGRPLKDKDFNEIDRLFKGPITSTGPKGTRTWNFTKKSRLPETGTKVNIPASKINHQIIADQYGIDVELIKGKDWIEILEVLRRSGLYAQGGLAGILQAPRRGYAEGGWSPGAGRDERGYQSTHPSYERGDGGGGGGVTDRANLVPSPITDTGEADRMNFEKVISPSFAFKYSPAKLANLRARIYNQNLLESDDINVEGDLSGTIGPVDYNTQFTDQGFGNTNLNYGNFSSTIDPNKNINLGYNKNIGGYNMGVNYGDGNTMFTIGTTFGEPKAKGGLAGILEV